jgi:hypothetical protein
MSIDQTMTVTTQFTLELRCSVCDSILTLGTKSYCDESGTWIYVEPCEKCSRPAQKDGDDA